VAEGEVPAEAMAGANGFGRPGYPGPAPPPAMTRTHYVFRLLAVVTGHVLGQARLIGTYQQ
jgi:phosphatidylethanolamine-binding protein (PEBP) family uncharacterized protein